VPINHELLGVVVADQVLAAGHVTEEHQHVAVAHRPGIGAGAVLAHKSEPIPLVAGAGTPRS